MGGIVAVDISSEMLAVARRKGFPSCVSFVQADMQRAPLRGGSFDRVICNAAFAHFPDRQKALREMVRVLRPGGLLVISHPIGREAVNALHRRTEEVVSEDAVPTGEEMRRLLQEAGLTGIRILDETDFYLGAGRAAQRLNS
jgi:ubiquinone/menaquinone biosynthesis C-methylase UbiE